MQNALRKLRTGDGTNSAEAYLTPPADYAALRKVISSNCPASTAFVGDFARFLIGTHGPIRVEVDRSGDAFTKYAARFRCLQRVAFAVGRPSDLCRMAA